MSRTSFLVLLGITLLGVGCGGYSHNYMSGNGMPTIMQLSPPSAMHGGAPFVLTVSGSGFGTDSVLYWGGTALTTTYASATQVSAKITAADIMNAGAVAVYVHSGGANSNTMDFTVQ